MVTADLPTQDTTLYYYLEEKDGGIIQTYPGTAFEKRRKHVPHDMKVRDLRLIKDEFTLDKNGFQLVNFSTKEKEFLDEEEVHRVYYPACEALIKKLYSFPIIFIVADSQADARL